MGNLNMVQNQVYYTIFRKKKKLLIQDISIHLCDSDIWVLVNETSEWFGMSPNLKKDSEIIFTRDCTYFMLLNRVENYHLKIF